MDGVPIGADRDPADLPASRSISVIDAVSAPES